MMMLAFVVGGVGDSSFARNELVITSDIIVDEADVESAWMNEHVFRLNVAMSEAELVESSQPFDRVFEDAVDGFDQGFELVEFVLGQSLHSPKGSEMEVDPSVQVLIAVEVLEYNQLLVLITFDQTHTCRLGLRRFWQL